MALITLMDKLANAVENGEYVIGILLDFSQAFDTVNHHILLEKLEHYGIRGFALSWIRSDLSNRPQYVTFNVIASINQIIKYWDLYCSLFTLMSRVMSVYCAPGIRWWHQSFR